jgi:hypothetical protein
MLDLQAAIIEARTASNHVFFELHRKEGEVWLEHPAFGPVMLGAFDPVCDKLCDFLEREDLGQ